MSTPTFERIARLPVIRFYEEAFRKATGVPLAVVPPDDPVRRLALGGAENPFCALAASSPAGCAACLEVQVRALRGASRQAGPMQVHCFAGLTEVAVPVTVRRRHLATLLSGQVFRRQPTERDFELVCRQLGGGDRAWEARLREAYFATPVVNAERFEAVIQLLGVFAQYLRTYIEEQGILLACDEPPAVTSAKRFVHEHVDQPIALSQVVEHVRVSRFYFCKLFKRATGMTLTEYVTRMRLEKAKLLLGDPGVRISEVVFAAGFGSIPRFNSVFKRHLGMAPTAYRTSLRSQDRN